MGGLSHERDIDALRHRVEGLIQRTKSDVAAVRDALPELAQELFNTFEELLAAEEGMRQQSEELMAGRAHAEAALLHYADLFDFAPDGCLVTNEKGVVQEANLAARSMLNAAARGLKGRGVVSFVPHAERGAFASGFAELLKLGRKMNWQTNLRH